MAKTREEQIIKACVEGNLEQVIQLTEGVDVNKISERYRKCVMHTPLTAACSRGHLNIVEYMVNEMGADVNHDINRPALHEAKTGEIVDFLIKNDADIEVILAGFTPLQTACHNGNLGVAQALIKHGADKNVVDINGYNLIHLSDNVDLIDYLVSEGFYLNTRMFHRACLALNLKAVQYFAHQGVDISKPFCTSLELIQFNRKALIDPDMIEELQNAKSIPRFIETWNRQGEFTKEVSHFADEVNLTGILFRFYCSGEEMTAVSGDVIAEPSE